MKYGDEVDMGLLTPVEAALLDANDLLQRGGGTQEEINGLMACLDNLELMQLSEGEIQLLFEVRQAIKKLPSKVA
jgi:hypothetical protein